MTENCIYNMITYFEGDVKRINHALKVYGFARTIAGMEKLSEKEQEICELAAILHDIGIKEAMRKYNSGSPKYQHTEGPPVAEMILNEIGAEKAVTNRVCFIVGNHHNFDKIDGRDFQIIFEADYLVNIFESNKEISEIKSIKEKYFKTQTGTKLIESMYKI